MKICDCYRFMFDRLLTDQPWNRLFLVGGRSSGKSIALVQALIINAVRTPADQGNYIVGCYRQTMKSINDSIYPALKAVILENNLSGYFDIKLTSITSIANNIEFKFYGLQDHILTSNKSSFRVKIAVVEEAQQVSKQAVSILEPTVNRNVNFKLIYLFNPDQATTPIHQHMLNRKRVDDTTKVANTNYKLNPFLPEETLRDIQRAKAIDYQQYLHEYHGHFYTQSVNSIFNRDTIEANRVDKLPECTQLVIGVDPAKGSKNAQKEGDEWGVVLCGLDSEGIGYILADKSGHYSPEKASQVIANLYYTWQSTMIVAEDNVGGLMIKDVIRLSDSNLPVSLVTASKSKRHRANPIAVRHEKGLIKHNGILPKLEYQMTVWQEDSKASPDRLDAMVHAMRYLFSNAGQSFKALTL